jgi:phenylpropionate dioxygenase-like ring-hydroxylating dioxygenase large terminal subunit
MDEVIDAVATVTNIAATETALARRTRIAADLRRRMVAHLAADGTTDLAPEPLELDAAVYSDPARLAAEKREIFCRLPLVAGLSGDIPNPGDVILFDLAGPPILITRGQDRRVHAFLNVCPHRGARVVTECAPQRRLVCPFHAWTFDLDGRVLAIPGEAGFRGCEAATRGLTRLPVAEWNGLIFVQGTPNENGNTEIDVEAFLGSFAPELAQLELGCGQPVKAGLLEVKANWKYVLDTYGESYHFARLHTKTIAPYYLSNIAAFDRFERSYRINFPDVGMRALVSKPEAEWPPIEFGAVHYLFPNTVFFIGAVVPGKWYIQVFRIFPGDTVGSTRTHFAVYAPRDLADETYRAEVAQAWDATAHVVMTEDYRVAAEAWDALARSPGRRVVLGRNEIALQGVQRGIAEAIGMPIA